MLVTANECVFSYGVGHVIRRVISELVNTRRASPDELGASI